MGLPSRLSHDAEACRGKAETRKVSGRRVRGGDAVGVGCGAVLGRYNCGGACFLVTAERRGTPKPLVPSYGGWIAVVRLAMLALFISARQDVW